MASRTEADWVLPNARKGEVWAEGRKLLDRSLRPGATMEYRQMMQENIRGFLARLLATPKKFRGHINLSADSLPYVISINERTCSLQGKLVMSLTYGYDLKEGDDMIAAPVQATEILSRLILPGAALVNNLPFCAVPFIIIIMVAPHIRF